MVKGIEIIGEATYQVSPTTREPLPDVLWNDIIGMRHRLVHVYFGVNLDVLWRTVTDDLPSLIAELERATPDPVIWSLGLSRRLGCAGDTQQARSRTTQAL